MTVVHLFGNVAVAQKENTVPENAANDTEMGQVVELIVNKKIAPGVPPTVIFKQIEALLTNHGVNLNCDKIRADYKIVTYLIQGMVDRGDGVSSDRCLMLDTIRHALAYEEPVNVHETNELFGDLLGRLD